MSDLFDPRPLDEIAIARIRLHEPPEGYMLGFSGGKDSVVTLDLARRSGTRYRPVFVNSGLEFPQLVHFVRHHYPEVTIIRPPHSYFQLVKSKGLPTRQVRWCCQTQKENLSRHQFLVAGIRAAESAARSQRKIVELCSRYSRRVLNPILEWTDLDVWQYIEKHQLQCSELYRLGLKRVGCVACPMTSAARRRLELALAPNYRPAFIHAAQARLDVLPADHQLRQKFQSGQEYFEWWLSDQPFNQSPTPDSLFS